MARNDEFRATVNFGAVVDPSFGAAVSGIGDSLTDAAKDAAREVNKLARQQEKLRRRIEEGVRAGRDVSRITAQYDELSRSIDTASRRLSRLNAAGRALTMAGNVGRIGKAVAAPVLGAGMIAGGAMTGLIAGAIAANAETAMQMGKAQGYGLDFGTHMAYQGISKAIGIDEDAMGDLLDEMKNKIGEVGNEKMLNPLLAQVGLTKSSANKMMKEDPNKLFKEVMSRLDKEVKSGRMSSAEAGSMADQLFGGEAQKIISYMTTLGMSLEELEANARKYNLVTEESAKQAVKGQYALNSLWGVVTSGFQNIVAQTLGAASVDILAGADMLKAKLEAATPDIIKAVTDWLAPDESDETGPERLWGTVSEVGNALVKFGQVVMAIVDLLDWLIPDKRTPEQMPTEEEARDRGAKLAEDVAFSSGLSPMQIARAKRAGGNKGAQEWREVNPEFEIGVSTRDTILPFTQRASGPVNSNNQIHLTVVASPGQSPEDVGKSTVDTINKTLGLPGFNVPGAATFDGI